MDLMVNVLVFIDRLLIYDVPVVIEGKERAVIHALVDSGATISLFT